MSDVQDESLKPVFKTRSIWADIGTMLVVFSVMLICAIIMSPDVMVGNLDYSADDRFKLQHPPFKNCITVTESGIVSTSIVKDTKYTEVVITHKTKLICTPEFSWTKERSILEKRSIAK